MTQKLLASWLEKFPNSLINIRLFYCKKIADLFEGFVSISVEATDNIKPHRKNIKPLTFTLLQAHIVGINSVFLFVFSFRFMTILCLPHLMYL